MHFSSFVRWALTFINPVWYTMDNCICYLITGTNWKNLPFFVFTNIGYVINGVVFNENNCWARVRWLGWAWKPWGILQSWRFERRKVVNIYILSGYLPLMPTIREIYPNNAFYVTKLFCNNRRIITRLYLLVTNLEDGVNCGSRISVPLE